jgi:sulfur-oxidizing protein SoxZ
MVERPRIKVPKFAAKGEIIEIKSLIAHPMESGQRLDERGQPIPRRIINKFICELGGELVFACDLEPGIATNPYMQFTARAEASGTFRFTWIDDNGTVVTAEESLTVT